MNYLTIDTETVGLAQNYIYDVGYVIHDELGNIKHTFRSLISDIFDNDQLMKKAFYYKNIPFYEELLDKGEIKKIGFIPFIKVLTNDIIQYDVECLMAYNLEFDMNALISTYDYLIYGHKRQPKSGTIYDYAKNFFNDNIFQKNIKYLCIYGYAASELLRCRDYIEMAEANGWFTEKGNIKTSAEYAYAFITNDVNYEECHTALEDALIEVEIFKECYKKSPNYTTEMIRLPYKLVQNFMKKMKEQDDALLQ